MTQIRRESSRPPAPTPLIRSQRQHRNAWLCPRRAFHLTACDPRGMRGHTKQRFFVAGEDCCPSTPAPPGPDTLAATRPRPWRSLAWRLAQSHGQPAGAHRSCPAAAGSSRDILARAIAPPNWRRPWASSSSWTTAGSAGGRSARIWWLSRPATAHPCSWARWARMRNRALYPAAAP